MMSSFVITTPETTVSISPRKLGPGKVASGTTSYSVTNQTGGSIRVRLRIDVEAGADPSWFSIRGGSEQDIAPGSTSSFSIDVSVPGGPDAASTSFKAVVVNLADPDNDFAIGPAVGLDLPIQEGEAASGLEWWMIAIPVGLLVLVGGALGLFLLLNSDSSTYRDYKGEDLATVVEELTAKGYKVSSGRDLESPTKFGQFNPERTVQDRKFFRKVVSSQLPVVEDSVSVATDTSVKLFWHWQPNTQQVPDVIGKKTAMAKRHILESGLTPKVREVPEGANAIDEIVRVEPTGKVPAGTTILISQNLIVRAIPIRPTERLPARPAPGPFEGLR